MELTPPVFIKADQLRYTYLKTRDRQALRNVNLEVQPDEYLLMCGASGSGKSTLCRTFNGLIPHFYEGKLRGQVFVNGAPTTEQSVSSLSAQVGMVFQNPEAQLFNRTVEQEIAFSLESLGLQPSEIRKRIAANAELFGDYTNDEPFRAGLQRWLNNIWAEKNRSIEEMMTSET